MARATRRGKLARGDLPLSVADTNASLHGLIGVLSAVIMRERTGLGQHIDMAMVDATIVTDDQILYELESPKTRRAFPTTSGRPAPGRSWCRPISATCGEA